MVDPEIWNQATDTSGEIATNRHRPPGQSQEGRAEIIKHRVKWTRSEVQNGGHGLCAPEAHLQGAS